MTQPLKVPTQELDYLARPGRKSFNGVSFKYKGDEVKRAQEALLELGYSLPKHGADGKFGRETDKAVREFQEKNVDFEGKPLRVDGIIGPKTTFSLNCSLACEGKWINKYEYSNEEKHVRVQCELGNKVTFSAPHTKEKMMVHFGKEVPEQVPEIKMFLEVEIFDLNLENKEEIMASFGGGTSFTNFNEEGKIDGWEQIEKNEKNLVFRASLKREWWQDKTIRIQAKRKYVACYYNDGERGRLSRVRVVPSGEGTGTGKWPDDIKIDQSIEPWPTEELIFRIYLYPKTAKYWGHEETIPILNKIMIIKKEGEIQYEIDRFVSF